MTQEQAEALIKSAGWQVAAALDWRDAVRLLKQVASEIENAQWSGPGNR